MLVEPETVRQIFNDTTEDALWLVVGTPPELANTLEMSDELLAFMYPTDRARCRRNSPATERPQARLRASGNC